MTKNDVIWVAVKVERGFISHVKAYRSEKSARQQEILWRNRINPDYDETDVQRVKIN